MNGKKLCISISLAFVTLAALLAFGPPQRRPIRIFMAGDSTMQPYDTSRTPQRGWGQVLGRFFDNEVQIINKARGGRSTKSFRAEGLWKKLIDSVKKDDWVFIEFGHNDHDRRKPERYTPPDAYERNLALMVTEVRARGGKPVLLTPIAMRTFNGEGHYRDGHGVYPAKVRTVADSLGVPLIDLDASFGEAIGKKGPEDSKAWFMNFGPGLYRAYPDGHIDNTHLREAGALEVASLAVKTIRSLNLEPLAAHLKLP